MCVRLDTYKLLIHSLELTALLLGLYTSLESFTFSDREILRNSLKQDVIVAIEGEEYEVVQVVQIQKLTGSN